jgi:hypothetical protein
MIPSSSTKSTSETKIQTVLRPDGKYEVSLKEETNLTVDPQDLFKLIAQLISYNRDAKINMMYNGVQIIGPAEKVMGMLASLALPPVGLPLYEPKTIEAKPENYDTSKFLFSSKDSGLLCNSLSLPKPCFIEDSHYHCLYCFESVLPSNGHSCPSEKEIES